MSHIYFQWTTVTPQDYVRYEVTRTQDLRNIPRKAAPTSTSVLDEAPGWLAALNIQGVVFEGMDHVGIEAVTAAVTIRTWNDDPAWYPPGERWGQVWVFAPPKADPAVGDRINTDQKLTWYGEAGSTPAQAGMPILPWSQFTLPPANQTWHGKWESDAHWAATQAVRSFHDWHEWESH